MTKGFTYYDIIGIFSPSAVAILSISIYPTDTPYLPMKDLLAMNIGGSILLLLCMYVFGEFIQVIGKNFESMWWRWFDGQPTLWVGTNNKKKHTILTVDQEKKITFFLKKVMLTLI